MRHWSLQTQRTLFTSVFALVGFGLVAWWVSPGLPVIWGPSARASEIAAGRDLFEHEWTPNDPLAHGDGLGPVYNAKSCAACHFQGGLGGGGSVKHNATSFEVHARPNDDTFVTGTIHNFSINPTQQESFAVAKKLYPTIPARKVTSGDPHCQYTVTVPAFDPLHTQTVQATALFGSGWLDLISDKAIRQNQRNRRMSSIAKELSLDFASIPTGKIPLTEEGSLGKFGWKGQAASLTDFVANACANELGLGTPAKAQAQPIHMNSAAAVAPDLDKKQFRALVAFVKTLPKPIEATPNDPTERERAARGKKIFGMVGCAVCHTPDLGGVSGVYSDFLLYALDDPGPSGEPYGFTPPPKELQLAQRPEHLPEPNEWKTPPLWGVADSAPYMHDGSAPTLEAAITRHNGDAKNVLKAYQALPPDEQAGIIAFLKTLKAPPEAHALRDPSVIQLKK